MNMALVSAPIGVRPASLDRSDECARLDAFVRGHPDATPFHLSTWTRAVARGCGQRAHTWVAERADGSLAGIVPLVEIRSPLFGRALVSNGFAVGGGILAHDAETVRVLGEAAWALAETLNCPTLELRGGPVEGDAWLRDDQSYLGFTRPIDDTHEARLLAIPRKQRAEVRKSLEKDLVVTVGSDLAAERAHHAVYAESVRNLGTPVFPARLFREVLAALGDDADILTVRANGVPVASVLSLYFNGTVYPYWGGSTEAARGLRANDRMYFALMAHAHARGCTTFDFGRSKVGTGAAAFKKNWGFEGVPLAYAKRAAPGEAPREINPLSPKYRMQVDLWKKLPLWLANMAGPMIARGLG